MCGDWMYARTINHGCQIGVVHDAPCLSNCTIERTEKLVLLGFYSLIFVKITSQIKLSNINYFTLKLILTELNITKSINYIKSKSNTQLDVRVIFA